jgi:hypothetical protein
MTVEPAVPKTTKSSLIVCEPEKPVPHVTSAGKMNGPTGVSNDSKVEKVTSRVPLGTL